MEVVLEIPISFAGMDLNGFKMHQGPTEPYYQAIVSLKMMWADEGLSAEVYSNRKVLYPINGSSETSSQFTWNGDEQSRISSSTESLGSRIMM